MFRAVLFYSFGQRDVFAAKNVFGFGLSKPSLNLFLTHNEILPHEDFASPLACGHLFFDDVDTFEASDVERDEGGGILGGCCCGGLWHGFT